MVLDSFKRLVEGFETWEQRGKRLRRPSNAVAVVLLWLVWVPFLVVGDDNLRVVGFGVACATVFLLTSVVPRLMLAAGIRSRVATWLLNPDEAPQPRSDGDSQSP